MDIYSVGMYFFGGGNKRITPDRLNKESNDENARIRDLKWKVTSCMWWVHKRWGRRGKGGMQQRVRAWARPWYSSNYFFAQARSSSSTRFFNWDSKNERRVYHLSKKKKNIRKRGCLYLRTYIHTYPLIWTRARGRERQALIKYDDLWLHVGTLEEVVGLGVLS